MFDLDLLVNSRVPEAVARLSDQIIHAPVVAVVAVRCVLGRSDVVMGGFNEVLCCSSVFNSTLYH